MEEPDRRRVFVGRRLAQSRRRVRSQSRNPGLLTYMPLVIRPPRADTPASSEGSAYTDDVAPDRAAGKSRFQVCMIHRDLSIRPASPIEMSVY